VSYSAKTGALNAEYLAAVWVYRYARLLAIIAASVQRAIIFESRFHNLLSE
jgi:hypothetical protein